MGDSVKKTRKNQTDKSLSATGLVIFLIIVLQLTAYYIINASLRERSFSRMEEGVNTVMEEIAVKFKRDSKLLNATATTLSELDVFDNDSVMSILEANNILFDTMRVRILMEDETILAPNGTVTDATLDESISFAAEAPLGEHISNRVQGLGSETPVLRHFVPVVRGGKTVAMLYGVTDLRTLPDNLNIDNIYNASASVYIIDTRSGDFILDTWHDELLNIKDYSSADYPRDTKGNKSWDEYTADLLSQNTGYVVYRTPQTNGWQYLYYAPAELNEWSIAVQVPESEAFSSVFAVRKVFIIIGVILAAVVFIYYLWVRKNAYLAMERAVEQAVLTEKLRKAEAADRAKSTFLSNMSHDIRTPMNAIIGYTTLVQTNLDNREKTEEYLKKILSSSNHMLSLINDILDMSRIESGKLNIEEKECSISDIFKDMRNIIQTQMQTKQLNFYMDTVDVINEKIYCDKLHVNQVLLNLLSNAIKFTPTGGTVALTVKQKPNAPSGFGAYEIRVKDTGIGMSDEFKAHIFEPFERERNSTISGIQGTGLGMAITKNIIDAMGGTIEVNSEQGKGSEFIIELEFRLQDEENPPENIAVLKGLRALVADDSFTTCDSIAKMLLSIGMRTDWVLHGKEAVLHAKQAHEMGDDYHAYIIDWLLPDLNGIEVVRQIRQIIGDSTPIIIVTAYDWTDIEEEARAAGVTAFCSKPVFVSDLRDILISETLGDKSEGKDEKSSRKRIPEGTRLLLVEDNELNREIAEELLTESGFEVDPAEDGVQAVEMVKNSTAGQYSLILMDIQMPKMNGYEAAKAIRALDNKALAGIPIVAMTANAFEEDRRLALESGMNDHVAKPIDVERLLEVVTDLIADKSTDTDQ